MNKTKEDRQTISIRVKPSLIQKTRVAAVTAGMKHVDWVEGAFVAALHPDRRKVEMR